MSDVSGKFRVTLDGQGRLAIPLKLRIALQIAEHDKMVITRGVETYIQGYNIERWNEYKKEILSKSPNDLETKRWVIRDFIGSSHDVLFDKQGRITLPEELAKTTQVFGLDEVIVIGCEDHIEIWNPALLETGRAEKEQAVVAAMNKNEDGSTAQNDVTNPVAC